MLSIYFAKYNLILVDGNQYFKESFKCFLDTVYTLKLYTVKDNEICITYNKELQDILNGCLDITLSQYVQDCKAYIKLNKIFCNIVIYFSLSALEKEQEIFNFIDKQTITKYINKYIKSLKKKKINFFTHREADTLKFSSKFEIKHSVSGKLQETLNIINFNLS